MSKSNLRAIITDDGDRELYTLSGLSAKKLFKILKENKDMLRDIDPVKENSVCFQFKEVDAGVLISSSLSITLRLGQIIIFTPAEETKEL
jgi:hypothetical protein